jgi:hypothetical protein
MWSINLWRLWNPYSGHRTTLVWTPAPAQCSVLSPLITKLILQLWHTITAYYSICSYLTKSTAGHGSRALWGMYCIVFARSEAGIVGSNPTQGLNVWCVCAFFCVFVVLCLGRVLATSWSPVQGVLPSVNDQETKKSALCSKKWEQAPK